jgi:hypothetical protein
VGPAINYQEGLAGAILVPTIVERRTERSEKPEIARKQVALVITKKPEPRHSSLLGIK